MGLQLERILKGLNRCPQCNVANPLLTLLWQQGVEISDEAGRNWATYECSSCHKVTLAEGHLATADHGRVYGNGSEEVRLLYPAPASVDASLPVDAQRYLRQAIETKFAPDACIVMAASAVDAMLREKGYKNGSLNDRIKNAVDDHTLTEAMAKWAHKVRLDANAVRHVDDSIKPPSEAEAQQAIEFAKALGDFLYVFTARVEEGIKDATPTVPGDA